MSMQEQLLELEQNIKTLEEKAIEARHQEKEINRLLGLKELPALERAELEVIKEQTELNYHRLQILLGQSMLLLDTVKENMLMNPSHEQ